MQISTKFWLADELVNDKLSSFHLLLEVVSFDSWAKLPFNLSTD